MKRTITILLLLLTLISSGQIVKSGNPYIKFPAAQIVVPDGLVSNWTFDDESGDLVDVINAYNGTIFTGTPTPLVSGMVGTAYDFNPTEYIEVPYNADLATSNFSASILVYANSTSTTRGILQSAGGNGSSHGWALRQFSWTFKFRWGNGSSTDGEINNGSSLTGQWVWILITYDGTTMSLYINNTLAASDSSVNFSYAASPSGYEMKFGMYDGGSSYDGKMDDGRYYNRVLTEAERNTYWNYINQ